MAEATTLSERLLVVLRAAGRDLGKVEIEEAVQASLANDGVKPTTSNSIDSARSQLLSAGLIVRTSLGWRAATSAEQEAFVPRSPGSRRTNRSERLVAAWAELEAAPLPRSPVDLESLTNRQLVELYPQLIATLTRRGVIRTSNLVGEYAEHLVREAIDADLVPPSQKGHDVVSSRFGRVQVKARHVSSPTDDGDLQLGIIRSANAADAFEYLAVILFTVDMRVARGVLVPAWVVEEQLSTVREHTRGRDLYARDLLMFHEAVVDITAELRAASQDPGALAMPTGDPARSGPHVLAMDPNEAAGRFPERRLLAGFEGGSVHAAESDGEFVLIVDESTMVEYLDEEDRDLVRPTTVYVFTTDGDRSAYAAGRGWLRS